MNLGEYLENNPCKGFRPTPQYSLVGDMLSCYFADVSAYAEPVSTRLTLMRSFDDKRIVGVKIHGIQDMVASAEVAADEADNNK